MITNTIDVEDIRRQFGRDTLAVGGISFSVRRGEVFGLLGPNGAGKTTTVRMLSTLLKPSGGTATVCGLDVVKDAAKVRRRIGYVSQHPTVDNTLTGLENLRMQARFFHVNRSEAAQRCRRLLELAGLSEWGDKKVSSYSGGMRRRLDCAAGFVNNPQVLFLDEPTLGLDTQARTCIWEYIGRLRDTFGTTVLLTTHYMHEADALCDRIALLDNGTVKALNTPRRLKEDLGGDCVYVTMPPEHLDMLNHAVGLLSNQPYVNTVKAMQSGLACVCNSGEDAIAGIINELNALGLPPAAITLKKTTLDDVYLSLTGKRYREDEPMQPDRGRAHAMGRRG
ncbi:MAG: ATP-binding cassette domain-containing protein [Chitinivibrionales bacterium]|nr:ATP-binding cassette domain-containing protein [Chitinivibrionales bacterium]